MSEIFTADLIAADIDGWIAASWADGCDSAEIAESLRAADVPVTEADVCRALARQQDARHGARLAPQSRAPIPVNQEASA